MTDETEEELSELDTSATRVRMTLRRRRHRLYGWIATLVILLSIELISFLGARLVRSQNLTFVISSAPGADWYATYLDDRDERLGWPKDSEKTGVLHEPNGMRPCFSKYGGPAAAVVFGDEMAYGSPVDHDKAWTQLVSDSLKQDVFSYGVVDYGLDQALLRYESMPHPEAKRVLVTMHTGMMPRHLTRNRALSTGLAAGGLKPRFILDGDELELIPLPDLSYEEYLRHLRLSAPPLDLPHESFEPGGPAGVVELGFPYTVSMVRALFGDYRLRAKLSGSDPRADMWREDHPLGGAALTEAILRRFGEQAREYGQKMTIVLVPLGRELALAADDLPYAAMVKRLEDDGFEVWNLHSCVKAAADMTGVETLFAAPGLYGDTGNVAIARCIEPLLVEAS